MAMASPLRACIWLHVLTGLALLRAVAGFNNERNDNLAVYWGQDSAGDQKTLSFYCQDDVYNAIPVAFLYVFFGPGGDPVINFANICSPDTNVTFPGTDLANCSALATDIAACQARGKIVTLSLGGATGAVGFANASQAQAFADTVWDMFLGGAGPVRPFGSAVLDGLDLDIEGGSPDYYAAFINRIRALSKGASKQYYITAAPQCPFPDANVGSALNAAIFDAIYVQFYNNFCGLDHPQDYNFATWDNWAKTQSPNPNVKVYIGAPGAKAAAGTGYVDASVLAGYALEAQQNFSSFGGVMLWDASQAYSNNRFDLAVKEAIATSATLPLIHNQCAIAAWPEALDVQFPSSGGARLMLREVGRTIARMPALARARLPFLARRSAPAPARAHLPRFALHRRVAS